MRVVVTGATGNVGTSLVRALAADEQVSEVIGIARRRPTWEAPKTTWAQADVEADGDRLHALFAGADAVVHLAWLIQPSRDRAELRRVNVEGSRRVFEAAATAGVGTLVHASSIGAYSHGPKQPPVDESHPTGGTPSSFYAVDKVAAERILDEVERADPQLRVARLRPALIFKGEAAAEIRRYFAGPFLPASLVRPRYLRVVPAFDRLVFQAVHADDVTEAYRLVVTNAQARGAYNVAADPIIDADVLARELRALKLPLPAGLVRSLADLTWRAHLQPTPPGWVDMARTVPTMDTARIRALGWQPRHSALEALRELLEAMADDGGLPGAPPLDPRTGGRARAGEILSGVGRKNP
jgi:UDP-glucose 4-epimerase